ncbi:hypothetical protein AK812_SmicGene20509 [Symbiodinium microadriaticum]|uniref:Uncharacterized protein n=1 Tax=Symbiodinium microadriaticum TaxID=2951 RepID=A0A1Q9DPS6_SYMMI|nr:hypothetical protein AK812_SmicGene20509 [Symbiodinium microadriaticum]
MEEDHGLAGRVQKALRESFALTSETLKVLVDGECSSEEQETKARQLSAAYASKLASVRRELMSAIEDTTEDAGQEDVASQVAEEAAACAELRAKLGLARERLRLASALQELPAWSAAASSKAPDEDAGDKKRQDWDLDLDFKIFNEI